MIIFHPVLICLVYGVQVGQSCEAEKDAACISKVGVTGSNSDQKEVESHGCENWGIKDVDKCPVRTSFNTIQVGLLTVTAFTTTVFVANVLFPFVGYDSIGETTGPASRIIGILKGSNFSGGGWNAIYRYGESIFFIVFLDVQVFTHVHSTLDGTKKCTKNRKCYYIELGAYGFI